jgi:hypothetical protein
MFISTADWILEMLATIQLRMFGFLTVLSETFRIKVCPSKMGLEK